MAGFVLHTIQRPAVGMLGGTKQMSKNVKNVATSTIKIWWGECQMSNVKSVTYDIRGGGAALRKSFMLGIAPYCEGVCCHK